VISFGAQAIEKKGSATDMRAPSPQEHDAKARAAAARAARESYGKLVAFLAARSRDVPGAEDALADAFAAALAVWPAQGVPANPEGWLATAARRRLIDGARRRRNAESSAAALQLVGDELMAAEADASIPDRRLALMFACAHPAIEESIRSPLMLQTILGLDAAAIGSAFLVSPAAMGQRLARAKSPVSRKRLTIAAKSHFGRQPSSRRASMLS
jgi:RNA polymerase sigma-70 factor (ECF subfamily)